MASFKLPNEVAEERSWTEILTSSSSTQPARAQVPTAWRPLAVLCPRGTERKKGGTNAEHWRPLRLKRAFLLYMLRSSRFFSSTAGLGRQPTYPSPEPKLLILRTIPWLVQTWWGTGTSWTISKTLQCEHCFLCIPEGLRDDDDHGRGWPRLLHQSGQGDQVGTAFIHLFI